MICLALFVFCHLSGLRLRVVGATDPPIIVISSGVQLHLLDLLGLKPRIPAGQRPERATRGAPWALLER
ncbi:hypothetical protein ACIPD2_17975 [Streptomyces griseofuscus]|uniref:hypothetical protein n=1 Tax=Streptomyces griseofuscus TaxID=146922 RepID=UPI003808F98C